jgi:hypothetical protein
MKIWVLILIYLTPSQQFSEVKVYATQDELTCRRVPPVLAFPMQALRLAKR